MVRKGLLPERAVGARLGRQSAALGGTAGEAGTADPSPGCKGPNGVWQARQPGRERGSRSQLQARGVEPWPRLRGSGLQVIWRLLYSKRAGRATVRLHLGAFQQGGGDVTREEPRAEAPGYPHQVDSSRPGGRFWCAATRFSRVRAASRAPLAPRAQQLSPQAPETTTWPPPIPGGGFSRRCRLIPENDGRIRREDRERIGAAQPPWDQGAGAWSLLHHLEMRAPDWPANHVRNMARSHCAGLRCCRPGRHRMLEPDHVLSSGRRPASSPDTLELDR